MSRLIEIEQVKAELYPPGSGPSLRSVREDMIRAGMAIKVGRKYYTTVEQKKKYIGLKTKCQKSPSPNSNPTKGANAGSQEGQSQKRDLMEKSSNDQVNLALELLQSANAR